jgi:NLE (NUC135) domain
MLPLYSVLPIINERGSNRPLAEPDIDGGEGSRSAKLHSTPTSNSFLSFSSFSRSIRFFLSHMATLIPPPSKRFKKAAAAEAEAPRPPVPTVVVQFSNAADKAPLGPPINLPADTERAGLELLVNKLRGTVSTAVWSPISKDRHLISDAICV